MQHDLVKREPDDSEEEDPDPDSEDDDDDIDNDHDNHHHGDENDDSLGVGMQTDSDSPASYISGSEENGVSNSNHHHHHNSHATFNGNEGGGSGGGGNNGGGNFGLSHAGVAGSITAEMKLLKDLHTRISALINEDPNKLQQIVDIVESSGKDYFTMETGITFDFDLCKLNSSTIRKLQQAVLS